MANGTKLLSRYYYKENSFRLESMDEKGWWFTGNKSFMSNGYVIYANGLDGDQPNPTAVAQGQGYAIRFFVDRAENDARSSYAQLISYLIKIATRAEQNEKSLIQLIIKQLQKDESVDVEYLDTIINLLHIQEYSAALTLLLKRQKDLDEFKREVNSKRNKSFAKTNEFYHSQFYQYLADRIEQQLSSQTGDSRQIGFDQSFESFVDEFFADRIKLNVKDNESLQFIRNTFINDLRKTCPESDNFKINWSYVLKNNETIDMNTHNFKEYKFLTKKGNFRSPKSIAKQFALEIGGSVGLGLSQEAYQIAAWSDLGHNFVSSTGATKVSRKNYKQELIGEKQGKNDIMVYQASTSIQDVIDQLYSEHYDRSQRSFYTELSKRLEEKSRQDIFNEYFEVAINVKGYRSNYDLKIEEEGSFMNRVGLLSTLPLGGNMAKKLIFMLNNTTEGCIMENRTHEIEEYIAVACAAWMWDDVGDLFSVSQTNWSGNYHKIYLFNSGGAYITASAIIRDAIDRLEASSKNTHQLVKVGINPPAPYGDYRTLQQTYPVEGITNKDEWQSMLQKRWDAVKEKAMESGTISIHIDQAVLNELLYNLKLALL